MGSAGRGKLKKVLGRNAAALADTPIKMGNVKLSRIVHCDARGGCSHCFPHGWETTNSTVSKNRRSWKCHRKTRYRPTTMA